MAKVKAISHVRQDGSVVLKGEIVAHAAKEKTVNYTPEQSLALVEAYKGGQTVEALAITFGKSVRSIVAKLSREQVYKKKEYTTKTGEPVAKKNDLADTIGELLGATEPEIESLTKVNKTMLKKILDAVKPLEVLNTETPAE